MFNKKKEKKIKIITEKCTLEWTGDSWCGRLTNDDFSLVVFYVGYEFNLTALNNCDEILHDVKNYIDVALRYIEKEETAYLHEYGKVELESIDITNLVKKGSFGLGFSFADWEDGTITVEFNEYKPVELWGAD